MGVPFCLLLVIIKEVNTIKQTEVINVIINPQDLFAVNIIADNGEVNVRTCVEVTCIILFIAELVKKIFSNKTFL